MKVTVLTSSSGIVLGVFTREQQALALNEELTRCGTNVTITFDVTVNEEHDPDED